MARLSVCVLLVLAAQLAAAATTRRKASSPALSISEPSYQLPSWFDHDLYKRLFGKSYPSQLTNEAQKRAYLRAALAVLERRALFRVHKLEQPASVSELSDLTHEQLQALGQTSSELLEASGADRNALAPTDSCCSLDQVYARIIMLVQGAEPDTRRALMDELRQKHPFDGLSGPAEPEVEAVGFSTNTNTNTNTRPLETATQRAYERSLVDSVRKQVAEQLGPNTTLGRKLADQFSAYFGKPVKISASVGQPEPLPAI